MRKCRKLSEEHKRKIKEGIEKFYLNHPERKNQISKEKSGKKLSDSHKNNISKGRKGKGFVKHGKESPNWQGGKIEVNCTYCGEIIEKIRYHIKTNNNHFCNKKCQALWRSENVFGKNHPSWKEDKDCITFEGKRIRMSIEYRLWRESVFARDNWTCQKCGKRGRIELNAHHIKSFAKYPEFRFAIDNGITYCRECHYKLHRKTIKEV